MRFKWLFLAVCLLALAALPAAAQEAGGNTVSFNGISFQFDSSLATNVNIRQFAGDPSDLEQPGGPEVAHTEFLLYNGMETPAGAFEGEGVGSLRFYNTADFSGYALPGEQLAALQSLLAERPDLSQYMVASEDMSVELPFMPVFPATQVLRGQVHYVDAAELSGIAYLTVFRQDVFPFVAGEFIYTFQGLSADGQVYISAVFPVTVASFPAEIAEDFDYDAFAEAFQEYLSESIDTLNATAPADITPDINAIDALVQSISLTAVGPAPQPPVDGGETTPPAATEVPSGSAGVLRGTWRLIAYGDPADPTPVIEGTEVTATFEASGVGGNAGCNTYGGSFQFEGASLTISGLVSTLRACEDQAVMDQEAAFLEALRNVTSYEVSDGTLRLSYPEGVLVFQAA